MNEPVVLVQEIVVAQSNEFFIVDACSVAAIREFVAELIERSGYTSLHVEGRDFGAWVAALGATYFTTHASKKIDYQHAAARACIPKAGGGTADVHVSSDASSSGLPQWVTFPEAEGTRRWKSAWVLFNEEATS